MTGFFDVATVVELSPLSVPTLVHARERTAELNALWRNVSGLDLLSGPRQDALHHMVSLARVHTLMHVRGARRDPKLFCAALDARLRLRRDTDARRWLAGWVEDELLRWPETEPWRAIGCATCDWTPALERELHQSVDAARAIYDDALGRADLAPVRAGRRGLDEAEERRDATLARWRTCPGFTIFERVRPLWEQAAERKAAR